MAETTSHDSELSRTELASYLRSIADELDSTRSTVTVQIGNKNVSLSPSDSIDASMAVTERSRRLRTDTEELELAFKWNPQTTEESSSASVEENA